MCVSVYAFAYVYVPVYVCDMCDMCVCVTAKEWPRLQSSKVRPSWLRVDFDRWENNSSGEEEEEDEKSKKSVSWVVWWGWVWWGWVCSDNYNFWLCSDKCLTTYKFDRPFKILGWA